MARHIDADALLKKFCVNSEGRRIPEVDCDNHEITVSIKDIKRIIREQPTSYDVDAVVADIEDFREEAEQFGFASALSDIVEVVRNGGVHE